MEPVPGSYAWKLPVLKEAFEFKPPFGSVSWQVNTSVIKKVDTSILQTWLKMTLAVDSATPNRSPTVL